MIRRIQGAPRSPYRISRRSFAIGLTGFETFDIIGLDSTLRPRAPLTVRATDRDDKVREFKVIARIDTPEELRYYEHGGILQYVLRQLVGGR